MQLENRFTIPVPITRAWEVLLDVERVVPCFPGAAVTSVSDGLIEGSVRIKFGPVLLHYAGTATFLEKDESTHRAVLTAEGSDRKGGGSAGAKITAELRELSSDSTECVIVTDLDITGRPAQFGRGIMSEVGNRITEQFAKNLSAMLTSPDVSPRSDGSAAGASSDAHASAGTTTGIAASSSSSTPSNNEDGALDVLKFAQGAALKRLAPVAGAALLLLLWSAFRGRASGRRIYCMPCEPPARD